MPARSSPSRRFFFQARDYRQLIDRARSHGCSMPIIPGLMPVANVAQIERFAALSGAAFPEDAARFTAVKDDDEAVRQLGIDVAVELAEELLERCPGCTSTP
jgi:methylenetetrahydrofolate reductase (NADPH)